MKKYIAFASLFVTHQAISVNSDITAYRLSTSNFYKCNERHKTCQANEKSAGRVLQEYHDSKDKNDVNNLLKLSESAKKGFKGKEAGEHTAEETDDEVAAAKEALKTLETFYKSETDIRKKTRIMAEVSDVYINYKVPMTLNESVSEGLELIEKVLEEKRNFASFPYMLEHITDQTDISLDIRNRASLLNIQYVEMFQAKDEQLVPLLKRRQFLAENLEIGSVDQDDSYETQKKILDIVLSERFLRFQNLIAAAEYIEQSPSGSIEEVKEYYVMALERAFDRDEKIHVLQKLNSYKDHLDFGDHNIEFYCYLLRSMLSDKDVLEFVKDDNTREGRFVRFASGDPNLKISDFPIDEGILNPAFYLENLYSDDDLAVRYEEKKACCEQYSDALMRFQERNPGYDPQSSGLIRFRFKEIEDSSYDTEISTYPKVKSKIEKMKNDLDELHRQIEENEKNGYNKLERLTSGLEEKLEGNTIEDILKETKIATLPFLARKFPTYNKIVKNSLNKKGCKRLGLVKAEWYDGNFNPIWR